MSRMASDEKPQYDLEPGEEPDGDGQADAGAGDKESTSSGGSDSAGGVKSLDVCPNCGASMRDTDSIVCVRCGFSLKELKQIKTAVSAVAAEAVEAEPASGEAIVRDDFGGLWLPLAIAAVSALVMAVGFLAGSGGLFPGAEVPSPGARFVALLRFILATAVLAGGGVAGLIALSRLEKKPLGDLKIAAARILAVVLTMQIVRFIDLPDRATLEWTAELLLQAAAFVGLSILMLRLTPRQAATLLGLTAVGVVVVALLANAIAWSVVP